MPELPEVERAASLTRDVAQDRVIERVETVEDNIVYSGITHNEFANALVGRKVTGVGRYGKVFYLTLDGEGPMPVLHLGMTGMLQVKGQEPTYYRKKPAGDAQAWPPRFMKFILHISATDTSPAAQLAFLDARRLGRIRLCISPLTEPPISTLGFDPILSMPSLDEFSKSVRKRSCAIKALLLDQSFSAGVGNWIADEILYQARVHPEQRANSLVDSQLTLLHRKTVDICCKAVEVNADSSRFPEDWLFKYRWGKGKNVKHTLILPSGKPAIIKWIKVGGRTSAYIPELQQLPKKEAEHPVLEDPSDSDLTPISDLESAAPVTPKKRKMQKTTSETQMVTSSRSSKRVRTFTLKDTEIVEESSEAEVTPRRRSRRRTSIMVK